VRGLLLLAMGVESLGQRGDAFALDGL